MYIKIKGIEREKELCVISMEVTVYRNNDEMRCWVGWCIRQREEDRALSDATCGSTWGRQTILTFNRKVVRWNWKLWFKPLQDKTMNTKADRDESEKDVMISGVKGGTEIKKTETKYRFWAYGVYEVVKAKAHRNEPRIWLWCPTETNQTLIPLFLVSSVSDRLSVVSVQWCLQ